MPAQETPRLAVSSRAHTLQAAPATIPLGQFTFNANQFGDTLEESDGGAFRTQNWLNVVSGDPGNPAALTGASFDTGVANIGRNGQPTYTIRYGTPIVNGGGTDLGIVSGRLSLNDTFYLSVSTDGVTFTPFAEFGPALALSTGVSKSYFYAQNQMLNPASLYVTPVDLSVFGVAAGDAIVAVRVTSSPEGDLIRVAGLNPDARITFDIAATSTEKVLAHKVRGDDTQYLSTRQTVDGQIPITGVVKDESGAAIVGATVNLRVIDPPDTAQYTPAAMKTANDNADAADMQGANLNARLSSTTVITDSSGGFSARLIVSDHVSGDNYKVEGGFSPSFACATAGTNGADGCKATGTIQVWKRVYVEKHRTLKNGMRITQPAAPGSTSIRVLSNRYNGNQGSRTLAAGDHIVLVHAPQLTRTDGADGWYLEYHDIATVQAAAGTGEYIINLGTVQGKTITPQSLGRGFGPDSTDTSASDAIARIGSGTIGTSDYFEAPDTLLAQYDANGNPTSAFSQSFVDYHVLPEANVIPLPWVPRNPNDVTLQHVADRWARTVGWDSDHATSVPTPSHQLLVIADIGGFDTPTGRATQAGETAVTASEMASYVFRGAIDLTVTQSGVHHHQNAANWAAKDEAHELTHQWRVDSVWNLNPPVHCPTDSKTFDSTTTYCLEADSSDTGSETQSDNLIGRFHIRQPTPGGPWQSEYFEIRQHADPFLP